MNRTEEQFSLLNSFIIFILLLTVLGILQSTPDTKLTNQTDLDVSFSIHNFCTIPDVNLQEENTPNNLHITDDNRFYNNLFLLSCLILAAFSLCLLTFWIQQFHHLFDIGKFRKIIDFILRKDGKKYDIPFLSISFSTIS